MDSDFWSCKHTWKRSENNTKWCLIGCAIGDFGTIAFFQFSTFSASTLVIFLWATLNGIITPWPYNYWRLKKLGKACH